MTEFLEVLRTIRYVQHPPVFSRLSIGMANTEPLYVPNYYISTNIIRFTDIVNEMESLKTLEFRGNIVSNDFFFVVTMREYFNLRHIKKIVFSETMKNNGLFEDFKEEMQKRHIDVVTKNHSKKK